MSPLLGSLLLLLGVASAQTQLPLSTTTVQPVQTATAKIKVVFNAGPTSSPSNNVIPTLTVKSAPPGTTVSSNVMAAPPLKFQAAPAITTGCANGNCDSSPQVITVPSSTGCSSGNCNNAAPIVVSAPSYNNGCYNGNCNNNNAPIVIRAPSTYGNGCYNGNCNSNVASIVIQAPSSGCYGSNCGGITQPIVIPSFNNGCYGSSGCGYSGYPFSLGAILGTSYRCGSSGCGCRSAGCGATNTFSSFGVPDPITKNGNFFRPKVRVPVRYENGNPVFNLGGGYSGFGRK